MPRLHLRAEEFANFKVINVDDSPIRLRTVCELDFDESLGVSFIDDHKGRSLFIVDGDRATRDVP